MQNFIIRITQENTNLIKCAEIGCFILPDTTAPEFAAEFTTAAQKAGKLVLAEGNSAVEFYQKFGTDGLILDTSKEANPAKAIKEVRKRWINNSRTWKDMKVDAIEDPKSINYDGMSDALAQTLNKCVYIKEVKEFSETKLERKSESAQIKDMGTALSDIAKLEQAKEDARKSNENLDEGFDDLLKDAEKDA